MRSRLAIAVLAWLLGAAPAVAGEPSHRFHVASRIEGRLSQPARRNIAAVGMYQSQTYNIFLRPKGHDHAGTAFLVERHGQRGLVLTNAHVVHADVNAFRERSRVIGAQVAFDVGGARVPARVRRLVTRDASLDMALLEVELPRQLQGLQPVRLTRQQPARERGVYATGFPALYQADLGRPATAGPRGQIGRLLASKQPERVPQMIAVGRSLKRRNPNVPSAWPTVATTVPAWHGSSGSPVFDSASHRAVGLLKWAAPGRYDAARRSWRWNSSYTPMDAILQHLEQKLPALAQDLQPRLRALLAGL